MFCTRSHSESQKNEQIQHLWKPSLTAALCSEQLCGISDMNQSPIEPNAVLTWAGFQWKNQNRPKSSLTTWPLINECKTHHNHSSQLWYFLHFFQHWWLQQLQKIGSALAFNLASNKYSCQINGGFLQSQFYSSDVSATHILTSCVGSFT